MSKLGRASGILAGAIEPAAARYEMYQKDARPYEMIDSMDGYNVSNFLLCAFRAPLFSLAVPIKEM